MDPLFLGALVAIITIVVLFSGVSVAIGGRITIFAIV